MSYEQPSSLIDEHGFLYKANKLGLVKHLIVLEIFPTLGDIVIVNVSHLFYHILWPQDGSSSDMIASFKGRLSNYRDGTERIIVFDKHENVSAKDH